MTTHRHNLAPESWQQVSCRRGISNECGGLDGMQSPINFNSGSYGYYNDNDNAGADGCINFSKDGDDISSDRLITSLEVGDCTFADLTSILKNQKSIQVDYPSTCRKPSISVPNMQNDNTYEDWELIQFHFHVRSEHTFDNEQFDGEFHLVHQSINTGKLLVIGVPIQISDDENDDDDEDASTYDISQVVEPIIEACEAISQNILSACNTTHGHLDVPNTLLHSKLSLSELVDKDWTIYDLFNIGSDNTETYYGGYKLALGAFAYTGSLTTPPCSTGVQWYVLDKPMLMESSQIERIYSLIGGWSNPIWPSCKFKVADYGGDETLGTFRPTQDIGNREVFHFCAF